MSRADAAAATPAPSGRWCGIVTASHLGDDVDDFLVRVPPLTYAGGVAAEVTGVL
ncbi:MAG: hypothetical protein L0H42_12440 [Yaniella sp.]|uniref:hypothetical protein n=1 Tax=Yaniella sp. TaxID=2773929 RepID=UPI00264A3CC5|nr:hypothetical protein [Yaniella sp.]MDN5819107.1 hypothetical protein [Yaniella sp.]